MIKRGPKVEFVEVLVALTQGLSAIAHTNGKDARWYQQRAKAALERAAVACSTSPLAEMLRSGPVRMDE